MSKTHLPPTWRSLWKSSAATQADSVHITRRPDVCEEKGECRKTRCSGERPEYSTCTENGHSCGGYGDSVQVRKTLPDNTTNDEKVVGEDTVNLKPSSGNGDRNVTALQISSAGGNSSQGTPHTEETGVVQAVATQQTALCRRETEFLTSDTLGPQQ